MVMVTLQVNSDAALKTIRNLEEKHLVTVLDNTELTSPSLPGEPLSIDAFKAWISNAESGDSLSLTDAKAKWAKKRKQLLQHTK